MRKIVVAGMCVAVAAGVWAMSQNRHAGNDASPAEAQGAAIVSVDMPELSPGQQEGAQAFREFCAACHGANADGIDGRGSPLIHKIYEPSHHGDFAFVRAAKEGVRSHHWRFGDMPPVEGVTDPQISAIIEFIRAVQRANGIN